MKKMCAAFAMAVFVLSECCGSAFGETVTIMAHVLSCQVKRVRLDGWYKQELYFTVRECHSSDGVAFHGYTRRMPAGEYSYRVLVPQERGADWKEPDSWNTDAALVSSLMDCIENTADRGPVLLNIDVSRKLITSMSTNFD